MNREKIVITGIGALTPNGNNVDEFWSNLKEGVSGIKPITYFDTNNHRAKIAGELKNFNATSRLDQREIRKLDPFSIYTLYATSEALDMSGLNSNSSNPDRIGVTIGSGTGGMDTYEKASKTLGSKGPRFVSPYFVPGFIPNIAGGHISIKWGFKGPNQTVISACASGTDAIGIAMRLILAGDADAMITGGTEACVNEIAIAGFANMKALSQSYENPEKVCRPFEKDRNGFVLGEGCGILVIESESHAKNRGATILAELSGYGSTDDAFHVTQPAKGGTGAMKAMELAVKDSGLNLDQIDYINAHGTSTQYNDKNESAAIIELFNKHHKKLKVSSTKSMTGHCLGAAGGVEAVASVKTILEQVIPPTINYDTPDPECGNLDYIPNIARSQNIDNVLSNTFGFGGHNAVICLSKYN